MNFTERLRSANVSHDSLLCVGLDPDLARLPDAVVREADPVFAFTRAIIDATAAFACAFKPQIAHFAAIGAERALERTIEYIRDRYPTHLVVLDAKRSDIGSTAGFYAVEAFTRYGADAVTVNPYPGTDGVEPFLQWPERGVFLLCRTSNPGSDLVQAHGSPPLFMRIAQEAADVWNTRGNVGLVVGATQPEDLAAVREVAADLPLLLPGVGAQGADIGRAMRAGAAGRAPALVNSSRAILYASSGADFQQASADAAAATRDEIRVGIAGSNGAAAG